MLLHSLIYATSIHICCPVIDVFVLSLSRYHGMCRDTSFVTVTGTNHWVIPLKRTAQAIRESKVAPASACHTLTGAKWAAYVGGCSRNTKNNLSDYHLYKIYFIKPYCDQLMVWNNGTVANIELPSPDGYETSGCQSWQSSYSHLMQYYYMRWSVQVRKVNVQQIGVVADAQGYIVPGTARPKDNVP